MNLNRLPRVGMLSDIQNEHLKNKIANKEVSLKIYPFLLDNIPPLYDHDLILIDFNIKKPWDVSLPTYLQAIKNRFQSKFEKELHLSFDMGRPVILIVGQYINTFIPTFENYGIRFSETDKGTHIDLVSPSSPLKNYFQYVDHYEKLVELDDQLEQKALAVIKNSEILIASEIYILNSLIVILPSPYFDEYIDPEGNINKGEFIPWSILPVTAIIDVILYYLEKWRRKDAITIHEPDWVNIYKTNKHLKIEKEITDLQKTKKEHDNITYLLWGGDERLEDSVLAVCNEFGLQGYKLERGLSADIKAESKDKNIQLVFEVTGVKEKINNQSKKVNQVLHYHLNHKQEGEKIILMANTYRSLPLNERRGKDSFSKRVIETLTPLNVVLMTTADLYILWKNVQEGKIQSADAINKIYNQPGGIYKE